LQNKRFVITGGSGFLGQFLIRKLSNLYPESPIHNLDINHTSDLKSENLFSHDINLANEDNILSFEFTKNDIVYHLAANTFTNKTPSRVERKKWFEDLNFFGTKNLLSAMTRGGAKNIAFVSTDMVYGLPKRNPIDTDHPLSPNGPYGQSKKNAEIIINAFGSKKEHRSIIFRPRVIIGPGRHGLFDKLFFLIKNHLPVPLIGSGQNHYQFISVYDCVEALIKFNEKDLCSGIYNLGSINPPRVKELLSFIINQANSHSILVPTWGKGTKMVLGILDQLNLTLLYPEQYLLADKDYILDISSLREELDFDPEFDDKAILLEAFKNYCELSN